MSNQKNNEPTILSKDELREVFEESVQDMLRSMGVDVDNPLEMQRDFQHLRDWRQSTNAVRQKGFFAAVSILVAGALSAMWLGLADMMR